MINKTVFDCKRIIVAFVIMLLSIVPCTSAFAYRGRVARSAMNKLFSSSASLDYSSTGVSRMETFRSLLAQWGAPGSSGCASPDGDLEPVDVHVEDLHPLLIPIAKSKETGNVVCALKIVSSSAEEASSQPLPIVESKVGAPGYNLLALNSEHMMRRIACEADVAGKQEIVDLYNDELGQGKLKDSGLDSAYEPGSVEKLGYGLDKYVLLRVGPFPDLYKAMSTQHLQRNDESSALIAAEAANGKFSGFGSSYYSYAQLLSSLPNRDEEARDAARICLRLPISSSSFQTSDLQNISKIAGLSDESDDMDGTLAKMQEMYEKIRESEKEEEGTQTAGSRTPEQVALDEATYFLDRAAMSGASWKDVRSDLAEIYEQAMRPDMSIFVDKNRFQ